MKDRVETPDIEYFKADLSKTEKFEEVDITSKEYKEAFDKLLNEVVNSVLENSHTFAELKWYMKQYYWSYEMLEQDNLPINILFEEWDPDEEWIEESMKENRERNYQYA